MRRFVQEAGLLDLIIRKFWELSSICRSATQWVVSLSGRLGGEAQTERQNQDGGTERTTVDGSFHGSFRVSQSTFALENGLDSSPTRSDPGRKDTGRFSFVGCSGRAD